MVQPNNRREKKKETLMSEVQLAKELNDPAYLYRYLSIQLNQ